MRNAKSHGPKFRASSILNAAQQSKRKPSAMDGDDDICPICMDVLELTDKSFNPCPCGFRLCVWCFHNINDKANGKCPACRSPYEVTAIVEHDIDPALVAAANEEHRERTHKEKVLVENTPSPVNDKTLQEMRIVQRNLVYVIGIPSSLAREESIKRNDLFIRYGKVTKVAVNKKTAHSNAPRPSFSAYITYRTREDALAAIRGLSGVIVEGRALKATYGTTKYCSFFLRGVACSNPSCLYLHKVADDEDCFTKEALANADRFSVHAYSRANSRAGALEREQSPGLTTTTPVVVNVKTTSVPSTITTPKKPSTRSNPKVTPRKTPVVTSKSRPAPRGVLKSTPSKEHSASKTPTVHPAPMPSPVAELNRESVPLHGHSDSPSTCSSQIVFYYIFKQPLTPL